MRQKSIFSAIITGITLGVINPGQNGVIIKDPITGLGNILAHTKDAIFHNLKEGVWIGKRQISGFGLSTYILEHLNTNVLHYAVMINGEAFHLYGEKGKSSGSGTQVRIEPLKESYQNFEWFYKGKAERSISQLKQFIEKINNLSFRYDLLVTNCIDVAKALSFYARGAYDEEIALGMIYPKSAIGIILKGTGLQRIGQLLLEGANLIVP